MLLVAQKKPKNVAAERLIFKNPVFWQKESKIKGFSLRYEKWYILSYGSL